MPLNLFIFSYLIILFAFAFRSRIFQLFSGILWLWLFVYCLNYVSFLYCLGAFVILKIMFRAPSTEEEGDDDQVSLLFNQHQVF